MNKLEPALRPLVDKGLKSVLIFGVSKTAKKVSSALNVSSPTCYSYSIDWSLAVCVVVEWLHKSNINTCIKFSNF